MSSTTSDVSAPTVILPGVPLTTKWTMASRKPNDPSTEESPSPAYLTLLNEVHAHKTYKVTTANTVCWEPLDDQSKLLQTSNCINMTDCMLNQQKVYTARPIMRLTGSGFAPGRAESAEYEGTLKIHEEITLGSSLPPETVSKLIEDDAMKYVGSMELEFTPDCMMSYKVIRTLSDHPASWRNKPRTLDIHGFTKDGNAALKVYHDRTHIHFEITARTAEEATDRKDTEAHEAAIRKVLEDAWGTEARPTKIKSSFVGHLVDKDPIPRLGIQST